MTFLEDFIEGAALFSDIYAAGGRKIVLSGWLSGYHGKKVYIFMDEYDTPLQAAYIHHYYDEAITIMRVLFSETFKENEYLGRAVITGITRIAKESLFSEMNNLAVCSVVSGGSGKT